MIFYELLENGGIGRYTNNEEVARSNGFFEPDHTELDEDAFIVGYNGNYYLRGNEPSVPIEILCDKKRSIRNQFLADTDKYMLDDFPLTNDEQLQVKRYRQYLRDLPLDESFPEVDVLTYENWSAVHGQD